MPCFLTVASADDPRIAAYRDIRERDLVGRQGRFIAEGGLILRALVERSRFGVDSVLLAEVRAPALADTLAQLPETTPVFLAPAPVMDAIAGFPIHRGVLAIGLRGAAAAPASLPPPSGPSRVAVAVGVANHDNLGGLFRNAAAFGFDAVFVDDASCDPLYRKAIRVSAGAALATPFARGPLPLLLGALAAGGHALFGLSPRGVEDVAGLAPPERAAVLVGAEGPGLPEDVLARVRTLRIAMAPGFDSLNLATAAGIAFHVFRRAMPAGAHAPP